MNLFWWRHIELTSIIEFFQDVIHCIGGVQVLFPWLEYAGKLPIKSDKRISIAPSSGLQSDIYNNLQDDWVVVQSATYVGKQLSVYYNSFTLTDTDTDSEGLKLNTNSVMAHLHWRRRTRIQIPNPMATLYSAEHVHFAQTQD